MNDEPHGTIDTLDTAAKGPGLWYGITQTIRRTRSLKAPMRGLITFGVFVALFCFNGLLSKFGPDASIAGTGIFGIGMVVAWWCLYPPISCLASLLTLFSGLVMLAGFASAFAHDGTVSPEESQQIFSTGTGIFWFSMAYWLIAALRAALGEGKAQTDKVRGMVRTVVSRGRAGNHLTESEGLLRPAAYQQEGRLLRLPMSNQEDDPGKLLHVNGDNAPRGSESE